MLGILHTYKDEVVDWWVDEYCSVCAGVFDYQLLHKLFDMNWKITYYSKTSDSGHSETGRDTI